MAERRSTPVSKEAFLVSKGDLLNPDYDPSTIKICPCCLGYGTVKGEDTDGSGWEECDRCDGLGWMSDEDYQELDHWINVMKANHGRRNESISRKQLIPVVQSFKDIARAKQPDNKLQQAMGPQSWNIQVDKAAVDFGNYLNKIVNRIMGRLESGNYAPQSAMKMGKRAMDVDDEKSELSGVGRKATNSISKILGLQ